MPRDSNEVLEIVKLKIAEEHKTLIDLVEANLLGSDEYSSPRKMTGISDFIVLDPREDEE